jgi:hypothetical protein
MSLILNSKINDLISTWSDKRDFFAERVRPSNLIFEQFTILEPPANPMRIITTPVKITLAILATLIFASPSKLLANKVLTKKPNIVWIVVDDMSANFSCYGEKVIKTPEVDSLATKGLRFSIWIQE